MKYNESNKPIVCMMTQSTCYKGTTIMTPKGVLWHSTGANNPNLKRYVQPDDNASDRVELLNLIGYNSSKNDWNHTSIQAGLNAWIGKLANGEIASIQTMPWNYKPWGCGGSCNNGWIQFEICEDGLNNKEYFDTVYREACELTAYLCNMYGLNPKGTVSFNGKKVPVILCHQDSYKLGLGSNHADVLHWFSRYGKTMEEVRNDVAAIMGIQADNAPAASTPTTTTASTSLAVGIKGTLVTKLQNNLNGLNYNCGNADGVFGNATKAAVIAFQKAYNLTQDGVAGPITLKKIEEVVKEIQTKLNALGYNCGSVDGIYGNATKSAATNFQRAKGLYADGIVGAKTLSALNNSTPSSGFKVQVIASILNIRKGPGTNYKVVGQIKNKGVYTIVETQGDWGKLKSGEGWISLSHVKKI